MGAWAALAAIVGACAISNAGADSVRVLAQNVQFTPLVGGSTDEQNARADKIARSILADNATEGLPDVIGFTETFNLSPSNVLRNVLGGEFPHQLHPIPERTPSGKFSNSGLMLLSRYPIVAHEFVMFEKSSGPDALSAKGVVAALIATPSSYLVVGLTHQQAGGTQEIYTSQLTAGATLMRDFIGRNIPLGAVDYTGVLYMGDLNIRYPSELYEEMTSTLSGDTVDTFLDLHPSSDGFTCCGGDVTRRIDYVFELRDLGKDCVFNGTSIESALVSTLIGYDSTGNFLSDHLGVSATINISDSKSGVLEKIGPSSSCLGINLEEGGPSRSSRTLASILVGLFAILPHFLLN